MSSFFLRKLCRPVIETIAIRFCALLRKQESEMKFSECSGRIYFYSTEPPLLEVPMNLLLLFYVTSFLFETYILKHVLLFYDSIVSGYMQSLNKLAGSLLIEVVACGKRVSSDHKISRINWHLMVYHNICLWRLTFSAW